MYQNFTTLTYIVKIFEKKEHPHFENAQYCYIACINYVCRYSFSSVVMRTCQYLSACSSEASCQRK